VVPATVEAPGHLDGPPGKLATFSGVASTGGTSPHFDTTSLVCSATYCHGPTSPASSLSPVWTSIAGPLGCDGCHGAPPPPPHLQVAACAGCHGDVVDLSGRVVNPNLHGDGVVQVVSSRTCSTCHGSPSSPAPPTDLTGRSERSSPGVGAHQAHLSGGRTSRPVPCRACHLVPATEDTPGHLDQEPGAEVIFSDLAVQNGATPAFDPVSLTCAGSYCHGPVDPSSSGTPAWNTTAAPLPLPCNACHGMPPATPAHAGTTLATCPTCHRHVASAGGVVTLLDPSLHVNGSVDF
jgi:predicted CxxxxCH...CXXCH cytochrome family protein